MSDYAQVANRIDELEKKINETISHRRTMTRVVLIGGILFALFIAGYLSFFHSLVLDVLEPKNLMSLLGGEARDMLPRAKLEFQNNLKAMAPRLAKEARLLAMQRIPEVRVLLEKEFINSANQYIGQLENEVDSIVRQGIDKHRDQYAKFIAAPDDPKAEEEFRDAIRAILDGYLNDPLLKSDLESYTKVLNGLRDKLIHLRDSKELTEQERIELDLILSVRELARRKI